MELIDGVEYRVRLTRLYYPSPEVVWEGECKLYIQRRKDGTISVVTPRPEEIPVSWAEYSEDDVQHDGSLVCEDYLMEFLT